MYFQSSYSTSRNKLQSCIFNTCRKTLVDMILHFVWSLLFTINSITVFFQCHLVIALKYFSPWPSSLPYYPPRVFKWFSNVCIRGQRQRISTVFFFFFLLWLAEKYDLLICFPECLGYLLIFIQNFFVASDFFNISQLSKFLKGTSILGLYTVLKKVKVKSRLPYH